jgi:hypothetical protein
MAVESAAPAKLSPTGLEKIVTVLRVRPNLSSNAETVKSLMDQVKFAAQLRGVDGADAARLEALRQRLLPFTGVALFIVRSVTIFPSPPRKIGGPSLTVFDTYLTPNLEERQSPRIVCVGRRHKWWLDRGRV